MVEEVLPRSSRLSEPAVANVDHVLLVFSATLPAFQPAPATRYLLSAEAAWLPVSGAACGWHWVVISSWRSAVAARLWHH